MKLSKLIVVNSEESLTISCLRSLSYYGGHGSIEPKYEHGVFQQTCNTSGKNDDWKRMEVGVKGLSIKWERGARTKSIVTYQPVPSISAGVKVRGGDVYVG
jgi:hypothetical protein